MLHAVKLLDFVYLLGTAAHRESQCFQLVHLLDGQSSGSLYYLVDVGVFYEIDLLMEVVLAFVHKVHNSVWQVHKSLLIPQILLLFPRVQREREYFVGRTVVFVFGVEGGIVYLWAKIDILPDKTRIERLTRGRHNS